MPEKKKRNRTYKTVYLNHLHQFSALVFIIIILIFGICTTFLISIPERTRLLQKSHDAAMEVSLYMQNKSTDLWKIYSPIYEDGQLIKPISDFYENDIDSLVADPVRRQELINVLSEMASVSTDICWLLLYRTAEDAPYLYFKNSGMLNKAPEDFPFLEQIREKPSTRFLSGAKQLEFPRIYNSTLVNRNTYAISGSVNSSNSFLPLGSLMVGLDTAALHSIYLKYHFDIPTDILVTTPDGELIYTSTGDYSESLDSALFTHKSGDSFSFNGTSYFLETMISYKQEYYVFNRISETALHNASHKYDLTIWLICFALSALSAGLYVFTGRLSAKKTNTILEGVQEISKNNLRYRIPVSGPADEFSTIADNINQMAEQINDYIQKVYLYSLKQKNAELGELQAKFNPHFLYNTLEVIRSQLLQNGDTECADMILLLSKIFRNFISQKSFVSIREELSLCKMYLQLLEMRYSDEFEVTFDVDSAVLEYSIIRNLMQPVIENYFVHGFSTQNPCNQINISGRFDEQGHIVLQVIDNGTGIPSDKLQELKAYLSSAVSVEGGSYGLKNINDRIKTFYGDDCGLFIDSEPKKCTTITLLIKKLTYEQHVNRFRYQEEVNQ